MKKPLVYLIGSLRNSHIPEIGNYVRSQGFEAFDDWHGAGPKADDEWFRYEKERGRPMREALRGKAAQTIFHFDKTNLDRADAALLILPAGKSGHLEAGYMIGRGKPVVVLFDAEPERWDVMYNFASDVIVKDVRAAVRSIEDALARPRLYEAFARDLLRQTAADFGVSYEDVTRKFRPSFSERWADYYGYRGRPITPNPPTPEAILKGGMPRPFWRKGRA